MRTFATLTLAIIASVARAGDVEIVEARFEGGGEGAWRVSVTLRHGDAGWDHYADAWRVVGVDGTLYGTRTLHHPHENEQPFTRSLAGVAIPRDVTSIRVEAHDKVHGWSPAALEVDLNRSAGERFEVSR